MQTFIQRFGFAVLALVAAGNIATAVANAAPRTPKPSPTPKPHHVRVSGYERDFYFARQNASGYPKGIGQINQAAFTAAGEVHAEYTLPDASTGNSPWTLGASYVYANPLGANGTCASVSAYGAHGGCQEYPSSSNQYKKTDTTLPGFPLATLSEAWVQYNAYGLNVKAGDQLFTSPWAGPSDTRVKPAFYQGIDANYSFSDGWSVRVSRIDAWESRIASDFNESTLITLNSNGTFKPTPGFLLSNVAYTSGPSFTADANLYQFYNIADLLWVEGKWSLDPTSKLKPFIAAHVGDESSEGTALAGIVKAQIAGLQIGANLSPTFNVTSGFDNIPVQSADVTLPTGVTCSASSHVISGSLNYFLPTSGTANCVPGAVAHTATVYYGGVASPYTDSYTSDPSFTTSTSQGFMERQSPGNGVKFTGTYQPDGRRFRLIVSQAFYNYSNPAGPEDTEEFDADGTIYFNKNSGTIYHGLSLRDRYMARNQNNTTIYGGTPLFKANRVQLEYDF